MNFKKLLTFGFLVVLLINCEKVENSFNLKGKIDGDYNGFIYLKYNDKIDSALVLNNMFEFKGGVQYPTTAILFPDNPKLNKRMTVVSFMLENSIIKTTLKYSENISDNESMKFLDLETISGSESHNTRIDFEEILVKTVHNEENDSLKKEAIYSNLYKFISENPESEMCGEFLYDLSAYYNLLSADQMETLLKMTDISFQKRNDIEKISKLIKQRKLFAIGNEPPDLILPNMEDKLVNVKSFNDRIVLLEFWASWCLPCRSTNPALLKIYNDYNHKGFEIIGISIDKDKSDWKLAIKEDNLNWPQTIDSLGTTAESYNLNSIPFNLLLNKKGKIIAHNIKPNKLNEILNNKL